MLSGRMGAWNFEGMALAIVLVVAYLGNEIVNHQCQSAMRPQLLIDLVVDSPRLEVIRLTLGVSLVKQTSWENWQLSGRRNTKTTRCWNSSEEIEIATLGIHGENS